MTPDLVLGAAAKAFQSLIRVGVWNDNVSRLARTIASARGGAAASFAMLPVALKQAIDSEVMVVSRDDGRVFGEALTLAEEYAAQKPGRGRPRKPPEQQTRRVAFRLTADEERAVRELISHLRSRAVTPSPR